MLDWSWYHCLWSFFPWPLPMILRTCGMRWASRMQSRLQRKAGTVTLNWYSVGFEIHHWDSLEKNQQCLRNEKLRVVAVGFTLEGCIEAQLSNASFSCFFVRSFAVAAGCCLNHSYTWRNLLNAQNRSDMNLSTRQRSRRSATEFFEAWCQEILKISMVTLAWNACLRPYLALLVDRTSMMLDPFRVPKPSIYRLLSVVCRRKRHTVVHVTSAQHCCSLIADACLLSWQVRWTLKMDSILEMPKSLRRISNAELRPRVHPRRLLASPWRS